MAGLFLRKPQSRATSDESKNLKVPVDLLTHSMHGYCLGSFKMSFRNRYNRGLPDLVEYGFLGFFFGLPTADCEVVDGCVAFCVVGTAGDSGLNFKSKSLMLEIGDGMSDQSDDGVGGGEDWFEIES